MMYSFAKVALEDLNEAGVYYGAQSEGLGTQFLIEVGMALGRILEAPERRPEIEGRVRKYRMSRFPYGIFHKIAVGNAVEIVAVFDLRRRPGGWNERR